MMAVGDVVNRGPISIPEPIPGRIGPSKAMFEALSAYLKSITFRVYGGKDPRDYEFKLENVLDHFPRNNEKLKYPCASIIEIDPVTEEEYLSFVPIEETLGTFDAMIGCDGYPPKTCLWTSGDVSTSFQVDFWLNNDPDRQAVEGKLNAIFHPTEVDNSVIVEGPELYFSEECEFSLISHRNDDSGISSQRNEYRLRCVISASCANLSLRRAMIESNIAIVGVDDPTDPAEDQEE
jgi:hypothetical protein